MHAEFTVEDGDLADELAALLARLDLPFTRRPARAQRRLLHASAGRPAADLLAVLGAHDARLRWEEHAVLGRVRESANRLANCDEANARRAAEAGRRQVEAARRLMASDRWATLPAAAARGSPSCGCATRT